MKICLLIPIYQHRETIRGVIESLAKFDLPCLVIDDGSDRETVDVLTEIEEHHSWVDVYHCPVNRGKGAALCIGYRLADQRGFSHVIQMDADAQHDPADVARLLAAIEEDSDALILGEPVFDETAPWLRLASRQLSRGFVWLATLSFDVGDPLCGYRAIPLASTLALLDRVRMGRHMEFEPELIVRLYWAGVEIRNVPTRIVYHEGGLSHFDIVWDDLRLAWLYIRLVAGMLPRILLLRARHARQRRHDR